LEVGLRAVQAFPDAPAEQVSLCDGLEAILDAAAGRAARLTRALDRRRELAGRADSLAAYLSQISRGSADAEPQLRALAAKILSDAREAAALRLPEGDDRVGDV